MGLAGGMFGAFQDEIVEYAWQLAIFFFVCLLFVSVWCWRLSRLLEFTRQKLITFRDECESEREASRLAAQKKAQFLATASHDLRQPLQALGLFVAILAQRSLPNDIKDIVSKVESAKETLEQFLDGLLDTLRLDAGAIEAHVTSFPLQSLFDRMALEFEPMAERKGLSLRLVRTTAILRSDPILVERILRNLLSNAIFQTKEGRVVFGCRRQDGGFRRIEVWDSGPGISADDQKNIFQPPPTSNENTRKVCRGSGLGLAVVERFANLLGVQIKLRSTVGKGSMFAITLPSESLSIDRAEI